MSRKLSRNSRRAIVASLLGLTVGGGILASAASLGVTGSSLGAGTVVIASCDADGIALKYVQTYVAGAPAVNPGSYRTSSVNISGIADACIGKALDLTLKDAAGASLGSGTVAAIADATGTDNNTATVSFAPSPFVDAAAVVGAAVVIAD